MYPTPDILGSELCLEELRAASRGWLGKVWPSEKPPKASKKMMIYDDQNDVIEPIVQRVEKLVIARDAVIVDENGVVQQITREGKGRRMKIKEVNETQIIKAKLESPSGKKMTKRKGSKEQTMTLHTRAATDEIYDLFNQPLPTQEEEEEDEVSDDDDDDDGNTTDGDYTSGAESTRTSQMPTTSEAGDDFDETSDVKSVSEWSEFTERKHVPKTDDDGNDDTQGSRFSAVDDTFEAIEVGLPRHNEEEDEEVVTPISPEMPSNARKMFVPIPPEDYEPATGPYRDPSQISQNRLPFMTPIVEKTESSLGLPTARGQKDYFNAKTPSKERGSARPPAVELGSSPFREIINEALPVERIAQPLLGKNVKNNKLAAATSKVQSNAPLAKEIVQKGPIIKDAQCNPVDDYTRNQIFEKLQPPLSTYDGFFEHKDEAGNRSAEIRKFAKAMAKMAKNANDKTSTNISMPPTLRFPGTTREYMVKRELGAGAFAPVYLLENVAADEEDSEISSAVMGKGAFDAYARKDLEALKMEDPPTAWEFYIMRQAKRRLGVARAAESIINVHEMHLYADECYLIEEFREQGTLLDLINLARAESTASGTGVMDENLVMFFTIELFRTIEALHSKGILHGDLKADNCLVRFDALKDSEVWTTKYRRDGTGGWSKKGISLIDFGRGIDMKAFLPTVQFIADWKTGPQDCAEMRELRPWTYQIDYHGLAGIIHSMLFGKYIDTVVVADKTPSITPPSTSTEAGFGGFGTATAGNKKIWRVKENFKRYWQTEIWGGVFDLLLNPTMHVEGKEEGSRLPVLRGMKEVREGMEGWLEANCDKGVGLQSSIRRLEMSIAGRRK
ncbi:hypothetical protein HYALB_00014017 [Hymenoscyphus albidus]|uniref:Protein kinase domain-containing protein n=1 Tax=Hymenoscyphus albidus TaxID=595503 RepID=A0A9N9Q0X9_9HELO|nr:hypothetical protein HYALB_00014017 [Hymenoscyphus albidus]